jgi:thiamine pyrophosphokinase
MHIIFANGELPETEIALPPEAVVIAADGGARHCLRLGITPQAVIGDFDSLTPQETADLEARGARLLRYPADKDETDLELALDYALRHGAREITLYALLGGRWDMSFANLLLLAAPRYAGLRLRVCAGETAVRLLRGGETLTLRGQPGETVSLVPLSDLHGLTYRGLKWPLQNADLPFGTPRGVSNLLLGPRAEISLAEGVAAVFHSCLRLQVES